MKLIGSLNRMKFEKGSWWFWN